MDVWRRALAEREGAADPRDQDDGEPPAAKNPQVVAQFELDMVLPLGCTHNVPSLQVGLCTLSVSPFEVVVPRPLGVDGPDIVAHVIMGRCVTPDLPPSRASGTGGADGAVGSPTR